MQVLSQVFVAALFGVVVSKLPVKNQSQSPQVCGHSGNGQLQYVWGEALETTSCLGPHGLPYPTEAVNRIIDLATNVTRRRFVRSVANPLDVHKQLMDNWLLSNNQVPKAHKGRSIPGEEQDAQKCSRDGSSRLCATQHNTTAPLFGISMTSGRTVAIVQKFPDLLQQIVYEKCLSRECRVVKGDCSQTFVPYLFLTVPLGPVTLTGQDYVLVESGCVCRLPNNILNS